MSKKYRPYLSLEMMNRIIYLCHLNPIDELSQSIIDSLKIMTLKANHGITQPSFTPIVDKLGFSEPELIQSKSEAYDERKFLAGEMTEEEAQAYQAKLMSKITG